MFHALKYNGGSSMNESEKTSRNENFLSVVMSEGDLKILGLGDVAYIKPHKVKGKLAYVLHGADGSAIEVEENEDDAIRSAYQNELNLVAIH